MLQEPLFSESLISPDVPKYSVPRSLSLGHGCICLNIFDHTYQLPEDLVIRCCMAYAHDYPSVPPQPPTPPQKSIAAAQTLLLDTRTDVCCGPTTASDFGRGGLLSCSQYHEAEAITDKYYWSQSLQEAENVGFRKHLFLGPKCLGLEGLRS